MFCEYVSPHKFSSKPLSPERKSINNHLNKCALPYASLCCAALSCVSLYSRVFFFLCSILSVVCVLQNSSFPCMCFSSRASFHRITPFLTICALTRSIMYLEENMYYELSCFLHCEIVHSRAIACHVLRLVPLYCKP